MANVTVLGAGNETFTLQFDTAETIRLAGLLTGAITTGIQDGSIIPATDRSGGPPPVPPGKTGQFVQTRSGVLSLPEGYTALVETAANAVVFGNTMPGQMILSGTDSNLTFISAGGSGTVVAGGDQNRITLSQSGTGDWLINSGKGTDIINALGSGQHTISAGEGRNAILLGTGTAVVQSEGDDTVSMSGAAATVDASAGGNALIFGGKGDLFFVGGAGGATIQGGRGSATYYGGMHEAPPVAANAAVAPAAQENDDLWLRNRPQAPVNFSGPEQIVRGGWDGENYLFAGSGAASLFGGGDGDQLYAFGSVGQLLAGSSGFATLSAALNWGDNTIRGGGGDEAMTGGTGADIFIAGGGADTVFATDGKQDLFTFLKGASGGTALIQNIFDAENVQIDLVNYASDEAANALANQTTNGSSVSFTLSDGTKVTFDNIAGLTDRNFL